MNHVDQALSRADVSDASGPGNPLTDLVDPRVTVILPALSHADRTSGEVDVWT